MSILNRKGDKTWVNCTWSGPGWLRLPINGPIEVNSDSIVWLASRLESATNDWYRQRELAEKLEADNVVLAGHLESALAAHRESLSDVKKELHALESSWKAQTEALDSAEGKLAKVLKENQELKNRIWRYEFKASLAPFTNRPVCPACTCKDSASEPFTFRHAANGFPDTIYFLECTCPRCGHIICMNRADT